MLVVRYAPFTPAIKFVVPPDKFVAFRDTFCALAFAAFRLMLIVPEDAIAALLPPYLEPWDIRVGVLPEPETALKEKADAVPDAAERAPDAATVPLEAVENELTKVFAISTAVIVTLPADAATPL